MSQVRITPEANISLLKRLKFLGLFIAELWKLGRLEHKLTWGTPGNFPVSRLGSPSLFGLLNINSK